MEHRAAKHPEVKSGSRNDGEQIAKKKTSYTEGKVYNCLLSDDLLCHFYVEG